MLPAVADSEHRHTFNNKAELLAGWLVKVPHAKCFSGANLLSDSCAFWNIEINAADQPCYLIVSQYTDTEQTSTGVNTFLTKQNQMSYLPCIKYSGLPISVSCPVHRNVNDEECLPFVPL